LELSEQLLPWVPRGEPEVIAVPPPDAFGGKPPQLALEGLDVPVLDLRGQTKLLEGQDEIVSRGELVLRGRDHAPFQGLGCSRHDDVANPLAVERWTTSPS